METCAVGRLTWQRTRTLDFASADLFPPSWAVYGDLLGTIKADDAIAY